MRHRPADGHVIGWVGFPRLAHAIAADLAGDHDMLLGGGDRRGRADNAAICGSWAWPADLPPHDHQTHYSKIGTRRPDVKHQMRPECIGGGSEGAAEELGPV
jgi:hypothetical protein